MKCENNLCTYFDNNVCILNGVEINSLGMCDACIVVDIPEEYLHQKRQATLKRFEAQYKEWEERDKAKS